MRKVELMPTRDCEAGYGPGHSPVRLQTNVWGRGNVSPCNTSARISNSSVSPSVTEITLAMVLLYIFPIASVICLGIPYAWSIFNILPRWMISKAFLKSM